MAGRLGQLKSNGGGAKTYLDSPKGVGQKTLNNNNKKGIQYMRMIVMLIAVKYEHFDCVEYALNNGAKGPDNIDVLMKKYIISKNTVLKEFEDTREDLPEKFKDKMDELIADMDNIW